MTIAAVVLAAGASSRMGRNKLLIDLAGKSLVEHAVDAALGSGADPVLVVTGHDGEAVRRQIGGRPVRFVDNPDFRDGLSTSIRHGVAALGGEVTGVLVCLGDMPDIDAALLRRMITVFNPHAGRTIIVPMRAGRRGNPVLWGRGFFGDLMSLTGDAGAKDLFLRHADLVASVEVADDAVLTDLDTPDAVARWQAGRRHAT